MICAFSDIMLQLKLNERKTFHLSCKFDFIGQSVTQRTQTM